MNEIEKVLEKHMSKIKTGILTEMESDLWFALEANLNTLRAAQAEIERLRERIKEPEQQTHLCLQDECEQFFRDPPRCDWDAESFCFIPLNEDRGGNIKKHAACTLRAAEILSQIGATAYAESFRAKPGRGERREEKTKVGYLVLKAQESVFTEQMQNHMDVADAILALIEGEQHDNI